MKKDQDHGVSEQKEDDISTREGSLETKIILCRSRGKTMHKKDPPLQITEGIEEESQLV